MFLSVKNFVSSKTNTPFLCVNFGGLLCAVWRDQREIWGWGGEWRDRETNRQTTDRESQRQTDRDRGKAGKGVYASQCPWHCCISLDYARKTVSGVTVLSVNLCP